MDGFDKSGVTEIFAWTHFGQKNHEAEFSLSRRVLCCLCGNQGHCHLSLPGPSKTKGCPSVTVGEKATGVLKALHGLPEHWGCRARRPVLKKKKINVILFPEGEKIGIQFLNVYQEHDLCHVWTMQKGLG